jgi:hypothetical protein
MADEEKTTLSEKRRMAGLATAPAVKRKIREQVAKKYPELDEAAREAIVRDRYSDLMTKRGRLGGRPRTAGTHR